MDTRGLYEKYDVRRWDGKPMGWTFILEPEKDEAAVRALWEYANAARCLGRSALANDLEKRLRDIAAS